MVIVHTYIIVKVELQWNKSKNLIYLFNALIRTYIVYVGHVAITSSYSCDTYVYIYTYYYMCVYYTTEYSTKCMQTQT